MCLLLLLYNIKANVLDVGGDSKTLMIVQVSPVEKNSGETICSLSFAARVRSVELGQSSRTSDSAEIAALKDRLRLYEVYINVIEEHSDCHALKTLLMLSGSIGCFSSDWFAKTRIRHSK